MSVQSVLDSLRQDSKFVANVAAWERNPAPPAHEVDFPAVLDEALAEMLGRGGIHKLYTHQAQALEAATAGKHFFVVTPTARRHPLCSNLPVLQACPAFPMAQALYLF